MSRFNLKNNAYVLFMLGLFFLPTPGLPQTVSGMKTGLEQLKSVLSKENVAVDPEIIWSNPFYSISPVTKDPPKDFHKEKGAFIGVIHIQRAIGAFNLEQKGTYAIRMKRVGLDWSMEFLNKEGKVVSTVKPQVIEFYASPLSSPRVYTVPGFASKYGQTVLLWCWDNFCGSLPFP